MRGVISQNTAQNKLTRLFIYNAVGTIMYANIVYLVYFIIYAMYKYTNLMECTMITGNYIQDNILLRKSGIIDGTPLAELLDRTKKYLSTEDILTICLRNNLIEFAYLCFCAISIYTYLIIISIYVIKRYREMQTRYLPARTHIRTHCTYTPNS